ncbi:MAG: pyridoxamine 5'-phosphate oxidase family protein [Chloroflexales bacterium]|nr:pyridoxamine 5'-phosphate oxidase family protein [Chloroflexales bacterium]
MIATHDTLPSITPQDQALEQYWPAIRRVFSAARRSTMHYAIASVNADGTPHISPIGSVFLTEPGRGFYFELFTRGLPQNVQRNQRICVMAVNAGRFFWLRSLFSGRFAEPPAIRLLGYAGERRKANAAEQALWQRQVAPLKFLKGYDLLWRRVEYVRELFFDGYALVRLGAMTKELWTEGR